jgi:hypothetical protein
MMKKLMSIAKKFTLLVLAISLFGCTQDENNLPEIVAGFTHTIDEKSGTVTFINISTNATKYVWDLGDGASSKLIDPVHTYANGTYTIILKASNESGASDTFEDIITINVPDILRLPITFDVADVAYDAETFNGTTFAIVANPSLSGTNTVASMVGAITNSGVAYEGISFDLGADIDLTTNKSITMNFWSDSPVSVLLKLEEGTATDLEVTSNHGGTGWEAITFDFISSAKYSRLTLFVDGPGTKSGTFYIDDILQTETPVTCTAETAQSLSAAGFNLTFQTDPTASIGSFDADLSWIANPDFENAVNQSCKVGQIDRKGSALFANNQIDFDAKFDFSAKAGFKMKVWSATAGTKVLVKLEDKTNNTINIQVEAITTKASEWEELTFDFAGSETNKYDKIILFFELNTNTTATYYIDDFALYARSGGGGGGSSFDDGLLTNGDFENGNEAWIGNARNIVTEGGNSFNLANVAVAGNAFDANLSQIVEITQGKNYTLSFEASSDRNRTMITGIGLNGDPFTSATQTVNLTTTIQTFTLELSSADFGGANSRVLFDMGAQAGVVVIDKVSLFCTDCGGGTGGGGTGGELATNGDFETGNTTGWTTFVEAAGASFTASNAQSNGGSFSGNLIADFEAGTGGAVDAVVKQANVGAGGGVTPNTQYVVSFDLRGSASDGGVFFAEFFSELSGGGTSKAEIITGGPHPLSDTWTSYSYTVTTGSDVSGGITLQMKSSCGPVANCLVNVFFDNVSIKLK